jgi:glycosyltransferase involved in cell wall biosynthesis
MTPKFGRIEANLASLLKLSEYMASGRPIVASNLSVIKEILKDKESALLFEPGDKKSFINAINIALEDEELAQRIARNTQYEVKNTHGLKEPNQFSPSHRIY